LICSMWMRPCIGSTALAISRIARLFPGRHRGGRWRTSCGDLAFLLTPRASAVPRPYSDHCPTMRSGYNFVSIEFSNCVGLTLRSKPPPSDFRWLQVPATNRKSLVEKQFLDGAPTPG
jgi:hypothetical protein